MKHKEISVNGKTFRVVRINRLERHYGYVGKYEMSYNALQEKRKFLGLIPYWTTHELENIPSFALIEQGIFGHTTWQSPLLQKVNNEQHPIFMS